VPDGFDEGDLEAEFAQLEEEVQLDELNASVNVPSYIPTELPSRPEAAPGVEPPAATQDPTRH
jgi:hypothetical protein